MKIAFVGCGYVADFYARNLRSHPDLVVAGVHDRDPARQAAFGGFHKLPVYDSLDALLAGDAEIVLNLTNPRDHFAVSSAIIGAGKHVYSEKPLGMVMSEAQALVDMAAAAGVRIGCAPCNALSETVQAVGRAIREGVIGTVRLAYANYDDGMIAPHRRPWNWTSESGAHWPAKDEFEIGCTYEHAGYYLTVLAALFGPATAVTAFASTQIPDKGIPVDGMAPDFSVGCVEYGEGIVARVTAGLVAPEDKSLMVVGDRGVLMVPHLRNDRGTIYINNDSAGTGPVGRASLTAGKVLKRLGLPGGDFGHYRKYLKPGGTPFAPAGPGKPVDFLRGVQDMADAIREDRPHRLTGALGLHMVEMIETLQYPALHGWHRELRSSFAPLAPMA